MIMTSDGDYEYDRENVVAEIKGLAEVRLEGDYTLELTEWSDGDFQIRVYHTIESTYPTGKGSTGRPFYREQLAFSTAGGQEGWLRHEVVRCRCGETVRDVVYCDQFAGYTLNWPNPIEPDGDDESDGPRIPYLGRFA